LASWRFILEKANRKDAKAQSLAKTMHYQTRGKHVEQRAAVNGDMCCLGWFQVANGKYFLTGLESERVRQVRRFLDARG
jgi:hypothetical protein